MLLLKHIQTSTKVQKNTPQEQVQAFQDLYLTIFKQGTLLLLCKVFFLIFFSKQPSTKRKYSIECNYKKHLSGFMGEFII